MFLNSGLVYTKMISSCFENEFSKNTASENDSHLKSKTILSEIDQINSKIPEITSKIEGKSLAKYLNPSAQNRILSNGIAGIHSPEENHSTLKVKVGLRNLFDELNYLDELTRKFGEGVKFRLDANGSMDLARAIRFCKEVERFNIDYVEQPLPKHELEDLSELRNHTNIPIAVDESLTNCYSAEEIIETQSADIFIIKPMVSGGFGTCKKIVELASSEKINSVITSSLETSNNKR